MLLLLLFLPANNNKILREEDGPIAQRNAAESFSGRRQW